MKTRSEQDVDLGGDRKSPNSGSGGPLGARCCGRVFFRQAAKKEIDESALNEMQAPAQAMELISVAQNEEFRVAATEIDVARRIQESLLPKTFPTMPGFDFAGYCRTARKIGGDFYDVISLPGNSVLLVMADVMGKGVPAALFAAMLRTQIRATAEWTCQPGELLARLNRQMFEELSSVDMFITVQVVLVDTGKSSLTVASAGHCPLLVSTTAGDILSIAPEGLPLGILPKVEFEEQTVPLENVSFLMLHTDGLTEAQDPSGEFYGEGRLLKSVATMNATQRTASELSKTIMDEIGEFQVTSMGCDDQAVLVLTRQPLVASLVAQPFEDAQISSGAEIEAQV
jgi:serine phosphatase RsbU (regulator of sigma subunit)